MGELQQRREQLHAQDDGVAERVLRMREESSQRSQEFIDTMRGVGTTALYLMTYGPKQQSGSRRRPAVNDYTFGHVGDGWVVTQPQSEGRDTHLIVLNTNLIYRCNLPGVYPNEQSPDSGIQHDPYVTTSGALEGSRELTAFSFDCGLDLLVRAVDKGGRP